MKKIVFSIAILCLAAGTAVFAQPGGQAQGQPQEGVTQSFPTEEVAKRLTDQMSSELGLTEKQYKKLYKFNLQDVEQLVEFRANGIRPRMNPAGQGGFPGGGQGGPGMGGGQGFPGGGQGGFPGGGQGGFPGGGQGGPGMGGGQGFPGGGQMGNVPTGERPSVNLDSASEMEEYLAKKEKKLRKLLTEEQFEKWYTTHPEQFGIQGPRNEEGGPDAGPQRGGPGPQGGPGAQGGPGQF